MNLADKERKQRYFDNVYQNAPEVPCACGCGTIIKSKDKYGRNKKYESGHNGRKYTDPTQYKREFHQRMRTEKAEIKAWLIQEHGGKCVICGYEFDGKNHSAFDFHHKDSDIKEFGMSRLSKSKSQRERMLKESEKCDLLCAVCHRLTHSGYFD